MRHSEAGRLRGQVEIVKSGHTLVPARLPVTANHEAQFFLVFAIVVEPKECRIRYFNKKVFHFPQIDVPVITPLIIIMLPVPLRRSHIDKRADHWISKYHSADNDNITCAVSPFSL
jgi:hypothetical protein